jgi:hypothetical protein
MLVGGVIGHDVYDDPDAAGTKFGHQLVEVGQGP